MDSSKIEQMNDRFRKSLRRSSWMYFGWLMILVVLAISGCNGEDPEPVPVPNPEDPVAVEKSNPMKIYMHYMPWFETPETNNGNWGIHWTMANFDPNTVTEGQRQIASHYYPLIGPYASGDEDVIEYHLLLMKYAGVDGVIIDWYGSFDLNDYDENRENSEELIKLTDDVGLQFAVMYEDRTLENVLLEGLSESYAKAAGLDLVYVEANYFDLDNYIRIDGDPILPVFGPILMEKESDWTTALSNIEETPVMLPLWYQSEDMGLNANGEFAWVYINNGQLQSFYDSRKNNLSVAMGSAYPGFRDIYEEGGWGESVGWVIDHQEGATFQTTLDMATDAGVEYLQLATWNDFGEGTMIEPTVEFEYTFLETLQSFTGVSYDIEDLEYIHRQYELRKREPGNRSLQQALDRSFGKFVSLKTDEARAIIDSLTLIQ